MFSDTFTCDVKAGNLTPEWAKRLGLSEDVVIGVGAFDAHLGVLGGEIRPYFLSKVMGTSTTDLLIIPIEDIEDKLVKGICGQVEGSVMPGMAGLEAGQSAFGDIFAWYKKILLWPVEKLISGSTILDEETKSKLIEEIADSIIPQLSQEAEQLDIGESGILALDWMNGRRTPDANQLLKGAILGLNLGSDAPRIFRALVEATAFGARKIVERFSNEGIPIKGIIALGGLAQKSPFILQVVADVINKPILVVRSEQACALGSAMAAAVVGGYYPTLVDAQKMMGNGFETKYIPNPENVLKYQALYR